jgi:hypothetical protein
MVEGYWLKILVVDELQLMEGQEELELVVIYKWRK